jgi:malonate-semialdehyde dehydrogenase (acetylating)/methylmalonate-semialdehyde dehydrogenase
MAASVMLAVGDVDHIIDRIKAEALKGICGANLGAIINKTSKEKIERYITEAEAQGATILVDGRNQKVAGKEEGYYVGPTIIDNVKPHMSVATEEIFGPVLSIIRVANVAEAISIENNDLYGNAVGIFTQSGGVAKQISDKVSAGMVGVNIGVPVPREPFSFGGWNESKFGALDITGKSSIEFWTKLKKITTKWNADADVNWMS